MTNSRITFGIMVGLLVVWPALAASSHHQFGWHHGHGCRQAAQGPYYDPTTETTRSGVVDRIWIEDCLGCACDGALHFTLEVDGVTHEAHLGPTCYLTGKGFHVLKGDRVEVTGAVLPHRGGGKAIVVREIRKDRETLVLRDNKGVPLWSYRPCW